MTKQKLLGAIATAGAIILGAIGLDYTKKEPEIPPITETQQTTPQETKSVDQAETEQTIIHQPITPEIHKSPQPTPAPKPEYPGLVSTYRTTDYANSPKLEEMLDYLQEKRQEAINTGKRYVGNRTLDSWPEKDRKKINTSERQFGPEYKKWMDPTKQAFIDLYYNGTFDDFAKLMQTLQGEIKLTDLEYRVGGWKWKDLDRISADLDKKEYLKQNGKNPNTLPWPIILNLMLTDENVDINKTALFGGLENIYDFGTKTWINPPALESTLNSLTRRMDAYSNLHFREESDPNGDRRKLYSSVLIQEYIETAKTYVTEIAKSNTIDYKKLQDRMKRFFNEMKHDIGQTEGFQQKMLEIISLFPEDTQEMCIAKRNSISPLCEHANINAVYVKLEERIQE